MLNRIVFSGLIGLSLLGCAQSGKAPAAKTSYFEYRYEGKPYVFGSVKEMQKFVKTKQMTASTTEYVKGYPVVFDDTDRADTGRLVKEYEKANK